MLGMNIRFTVHEPPGGTGVLAWSTHEPPLTRKSGLSVTVSAGTNEAGPWFSTTRYHSGPGKPTTTVPRSRSLSDNSGRRSIIAN